MKIVGWSFESDTSNAQNDYINFALNFFIAFIKKWKDPFAYV